MARPKKQIENEVKEVESEAALEVKEEVVQQAAPIELTSIALGVAKDDESGRWFVVKIPFDLKSGQTGTPSKLGEGDDRSICLERFRIEAANTLMGEV